MCGVEQLFRAEGRSSGRGQGRRTACCSRCQLVLCEAREGGEAASKQRDKSVSHTDIGLRI
jgi:hypothetical protein